MRVIIVVFLSFISISSLMAQSRSYVTERELESIQIDGEQYIRSSALADMLGGSETIDFLAKRGRTDFDGFSIEYGVFSTFVKIGDDVYNIYKPTIFRDGSFWFPVRYLTPILNRVSGMEFTLSGRKLRVGKSPFNVYGINATQKMNGLLVEILIKDQLRFDAIKTDDNWLVVTIVSGKIDSTAFTRPLAVSAVYEVKTYQFDNSCQISIRLRPKDFSFMSKIKEDPLRIQFLIRGEGFSESADVVEQKFDNGTADNPIDVIVIDPGHGGEDHGAAGPSGVKEKDVVLKIASQLYRLLNKDGRFKPVMTRQDDVFVPLSERAAIANSVRGDLFISIHANAASNKKASGIIAFFLAEAKTDQARAAASLENSSIRFENPEDQKSYNSDIDFTIRDMMQTEYLRESADLADIIQGTMSDVTGLGSRGVDQAGFFVLDKAFMPAVLLETAFISNKADEKRLKSTDFQKKTAESIYKAIIAFKDRYEGQERTSQ